VPVLGLAFAFGVVGVRAQSGQAREASAGVRDAAQKSEQTRSRRVTAAESSTKKDEVGPGVEAEATVAADEKSASDGEAGDAPLPAPAGDESKADRLSTLRAQIKDAKSETERARLRRTLVDYLVALDKQKEAIDELRVMATDERFDPVGFYNIGNALVRLNDTETAIEAYRKAIEQRRGHYSRALHNLGVLLMREGRWDEAQEALTAALRQEAYHYAEASYNLGRLYILRGEAALAIREWQRVLALQPDHADAALALARAYAEDGNPERAIIVIDSFTARRGANDRLTAARREILYNAESYEASDTQAAASPAKTVSMTTSNSSGAPLVVSKAAVNNAGVRTTPSKANSSSGASAPRAKTIESSEARPTASSSLRSLTVDRETYDLLERARASREDGRAQEAVGLYSRVLARRGGFFPPANLEISFVLSGLNRHEEAIASLQKLIAREGARYPIAYFHLGREHETLGQLNLAAEAYSRAATAYGEREPQFLLDVSRVREKEGNIAAALAAMEDYARISGRRGRTPDWAAGRISELRQKMNAAK
jgi:tetratricopeptide (TPR) repeat protein